MPFTISMQDHLMTPTPLLTIRGGGIIPIFPIKPQILPFTILLKVIQTLRVSNTVLLPISPSTTPSTKIQLGKFDGKVYPNTN